MTSWCKRLFFPVWVAALLFVAAGCDSNDTESDEASTFIGGWDMTELHINGLNVAPLLLAGTTVEGSFAQDGNFTLRSTDDTGASELRGTYQLDEEQNTITLESATFSAPVTLDYDIEGEDRITLETDDAALLIDLSGIDPSDFGLQVQTVVFILERAS